MKKRENILFVIGIDNYESNTWRNLNNAVGDCKALIKILTEKYAFNLYKEIYNEDATKKNIYDAFNNLVSYATPDDNVLIFFAGHGDSHPISKRGYWIPHEGTRAPDTLIENSVIKDYIQDLDTAHTWLISDSCYSGTFLSTNRGALEQLTYEMLDAKKSRWMLSSGGEEKVSDGAKGHNSPFAKYLMKYLNENTNKYTSVSEIIEYVKALTINNSTQTPQGAFIDNIGHQGGEMILILNEEYIETSITVTNGITNTPLLKEEYFLNERGENKIQSGKEILLVESFVKDADYLILETFRFYENGNKKLRFENGKVIFNDEEKNSMNLIQRFATWQGLTKYLDVHEKLARSKITIITADKSIEKVEQLPVVISYGKNLQYLLDNNKELSYCLHCGEKISDNDNYLIEIDEINLLNKIGNVHTQCVHSTNRIIGGLYIEQPKISSNLVHFDYRHWIELLKEGQGSLTPLRKYDFFINIIALNAKNNINLGHYCIKEYFENGDYSFVMLGSKIHRFTEAEIDSEVEWFKEQIKKIPHGKVLENGMFGTYEDLIKRKETNQTISKIVDVEKIRYSKQLEPYPNIQNDYAPVGIVKDASSDSIIRIGDIVPAISDIQKFDYFHKNWSLANKNINKCSILIIKSDSELRSYMQILEKDDLKLIIDPYFDIERKKVISGFVVKDIDRLKAEIENKPKSNLIKGSSSKLPFKKKVTYNRNDKVSVRYFDGRIIENIKYKKVEKDIEKGACLIM